MSNSLKVIATPIGNLADVTDRAKNALAKADVIFAEDTRQCLKLLNALAIEKKDTLKILSCPSIKEKARIPFAISFLEQGLNVALVSDAGCPCISDPGSLLVSGVIESGFLVEVLPGPCAISSSIMGSGLNAARFAFLGFLPKSFSKRKELILGASSLGLALVMYESPLRVLKLIKELGEILPDDHRVVIARELSKKFETFHRGSLRTNINPPFNELGECVVVVEGGQKIKLPSGAKDEDELEKTMKENISPKEKAKKISKLLNISSKQAYEMVIKKDKD